LGLAQRFLELALKLRRHAADFGRPLPDRAQHAGQLLRPDADQRHHGEDDKLSPCNDDHCGSTPKPPLPLGDPTSGNSVGSKLVAWMERSDIQEQSDPGFRYRSIRATNASVLPTPRQPDEASARGLAPADESAVW